MYVPTRSTRTRTASRVFALAAVAAITLAACGDDDDSASSATTAPAATVAPAPTEAPATTNDRGLYGSDSGRVPRQPPPRRAGRVSSRSPTTSLGQVLTAADGMTVYLFMPDAQGTPTCTRFLRRGVAAVDRRRRQPGHRWRRRRRLAAQHRRPPDGRHPGHVQRLAALLLLRRLCPRRHERSRAGRRVVRARPDRQPDRQRLISSSFRLNRAAWIATFRRDKTLDPSPGRGAGDGDLRRQAPS